MRTVWIMWMLIVALVAAGPGSMVLAFAASPVAGQTGTGWKEKNIETIDTVRDFISSWADSWRRRDLKRYMSYYSRAFRSGRLDYGSWRQRKAQLFERSGKISLEVKGLSVFVAGDRASATFIQKYRDDSYADTGEKTMQLIRQDGRWLIVSEEWRALK